MTEVPGLLTRIFLDTEFIGDGRVIEPASLALVSETGAEYYADGGADRAVRDHRPSVHVTRRSRRAPLLPGDASRRPCLRDRRLTPAQDTWRRLQRGHQPPVDAAAIRIRRPRRELLDDAIRTCAYRARPGRCTSWYPRYAVGPTRIWFSSNASRTSVATRSPSSSGSGVPSNKVENAVIVLRQNPVRHRAQQVAVHLRDLQASRNRRLMPPVLNLGNGSTTGRSVRGS